MRVIINADDCGINASVNQHINEAIREGKITSTTIMANMDDIDGAFSLYEKYKEFVSFGVHLNLTEGKPLLKSKILLDFGYYQEQNGELFFCGERAERYRYKSLPRIIQSELYKELSAQISKVQEGGVKISHLDSHHHIHTSLSLMGVLAELSKNKNILKIRNIRNYVPTLHSYMARRMWPVISKLYNRQYLMSDFFAIYDEFFANMDWRKIKEGQTIELMIHPGNPGESFRREEELMYKITYPQNFELINYNML